MVKRYPELIKHLPKSLQIIIFTIVKRIDSGKNCLIVVVGATGSGKSLASVTLMYWTYAYMKGRFPTVEELKERWMFKAKDFLQRMNDKDLKKKDINLWDEAGIEVGHKSHATMQNRIVGWMTQTFRNLQQVVFFTVPTMAFMDASVRKLLHYQFEMRKILISENLAILKPLELQYNIRQDKLYYHNLVYPSDDGSGFLDEVNVVGIPKPPKEVEDAYESEAGKFKRELNVRLQGMLVKLEKKETREVDESKLRPLTPVQIRIREALKQGIETNGEIAKFLRFPKSTVSANINYIRNKGYNVENYHKKTKISRDLLKNLRGAT